MMVSKTKVGATLVGLGAILGAVGGWLTGNVEPITAIEAVVIAVGGVLAVWGIRDWPLINKVR
jgi:hypothetical protein